MKASTKNAQTLEVKMLARIFGGRGGKGARGAGGVYTPAHFLDLGSRDAIDKVLARAARAGRIRRLARGLYDDPRPDPNGGWLAPSTDAVIRALAGRDAIRVQPSGANAANLLGLSEQVPLRQVFLTDGTGRTVTIGPRKIVLRHVPPRQMASAGRKSGTIVQALRWLGRANVDASVVRRLRNQVAPADHADLLRATRHAPAWIADVLRRLALDMRDGSLAGQLRPQIDKVIRVAD